MDGKDFDVTNYIETDCIGTSSKITDEISKYVNKYSKGRKLIDIGCAEGDLGKVIDCSEYIGVDPYSKSNKIIREDAVEYLKKQEDESLDIVIGKCCLHFFDSEKVKGLFEKKLKKNGIALFFIFSEKSKIFGNEEFNKIFLNNFDDSRFPKFAEEINIEFYISEEQMRNAIKGKCWSNHQHLSEEEINIAVNLVPTKNEPLRINMVIAVFKFFSKSD